MSLQNTALFHDTTLREDPYDSDEHFFSGPADGYLLVSTDEGQCEPQREADHAGGHTVSTLVT